MKAQTIFKWFFMPSTPQQPGKIIDRSYEKYYAMAKPDFDWKNASDKFSAKPRYRLNYQTLIEMMSGIMRGSYCGIHDIYLRNIANQRGSQLIIGLKYYKNRTGKWPENLDEIKELLPAETFIDPLNNGSFVYKLTDENFTFYSKGKNGIDENGKNERLSGGEKGQDDWPIWPESKCK